MVKTNPRMYYVKDPRDAYWNTVVCKEGKEEARAMKYEWQTVSDGQSWGRGRKRLVIFFLPAFCTFSTLRAKKDGEIGTGGDQHQLRSPVFSSSPPSLSFLLWPAHVRAFNFSLNSTLNFWLLNLDMMSNNVCIIPLATFKQKSRQINLWILITTAFYGKGNTPFKNTQRHLGRCSKNTKISDYSLHVYTRNSGLVTTKN